MASADKIRVLIVEDTIICQQMLAEQLSEIKNCEYEIELACSMAEALAKIREKRFDIILLDILLPDSSGVETFTNVRDASPETPIIVISGLEDELLFFELWKHGMMYALKKNEYSHELLDKVIREVIKRKKDEVGAEKNKTLLKAIISNSDFIIIATNLKREIVIANPAACENFGYSKEELGSMNVSKLYYDRKEAKRIAESIKTNDRFKGIIRNIDSRGNSFASYLIANVLTDKAGNVFGVLGISENLTKRGLNIDRVQKIEALGNLAAILVHDYNNLFSAIRGYGELALDTLRSGDPAYRFIRQIIQLIDANRNFNQDLLALTRNDNRLKIDIFSIEDLLSGLLKIINRYNNEVTTAIEFGKDLLRAKADQDDIRSIIDNLLRNSCQAMVGGGSIKIEVDNFCKDKADFLKLVISDTGHGIRLEHMNKVFEPFFTTKEQGVGTGIGLASAQEKITRNNGSIKIESQWGKGTEVTLLIPASKKKEENIFSDPNMVLPGSELILVIDEDEDVSKTICMLLQKKGYQAQAANCFKRAIEIYRDGFPVQVVIIDAKLSKIDPLDLRSQFQLIDSRIKFIIISGYGESYPPVARLLKTGDPFLPKPFSLSQLTQKIRFVLDG